MAASLRVICWRRSVKQLTSRATRSDTLDWFRGLGIMAVLWGHAGLPGLPGAYLFIDTFFVISGYLVCQSFLRACGPNEVGVRPQLMGPILHYFASRFRRIVIPLAATVLLTLIAGWFILLPDDYFALANSAQATLILQAHVYALTLGSYWDVVGQSAPLLHTWSLSLEEWFYLITPLLALPVLLWKRSVWLVVLTILAGISLYQAQSLSSDPEALGASYSMFTTRVWQFMLGLIFAIPLQRPVALPRLVNDGLLLIGLVAVFGSVLILTEKAASPGLITLPAVVGVLAVLILRPQSRLLAMVTGLVPLTFFGRKLYSLYLVHYPVMVYFDYLDLQFGSGTDAIKFTLAAMLGLAFYYAVEAPWRAWRAIGFGWVAAIAGVLIGLSVALSVYVQSTGGAPKRLPDAALAAWIARYDVNPNRTACLQPSLTRFGYSCALGPPDGPYFALFGDSHSDVFANQLATVLAARGFGLRHYWYAECPVIGSGLPTIDVFSDTCGKLSHEAHSTTLQDRNLAGVIYAARWPWYLNDPSPDRMRAYWRDAAGLPHGFANMAAFKDALYTVLAASVADFTARGLPVYVVSPVPALPADPVQTQVVAQWHGEGRNFAAMSEGLEMTGYMAERAAFDQWIAPLVESRGVTVLDVRDALCNGQRCTVYGVLNALYYDDNHLNEAGAKLVVEQLLGN